MKQRKMGAPGVSVAPLGFNNRRPKGLFDQADYLLERIESTTLTAMFLVMTVIGILQVIFRYFLELPLSWSEELIRYLFVWTTFLGAGVATAQGLHIEIDVLSFALDKKEPLKKERISRRIRILGGTFLLIFLAYYNYLAGDFLAEIRRLEQTSTAMDINMLWPMSAILVGGLLMLFHYLSRIIRDLKADSAERAASKPLGRRKN